MSEIEYDLEQDDEFDEDCVAALAKYEAVQRWRKESGSKKKYDNLSTEYLASLSEERRKEVLGLEIVNGVELVDDSDMNRLSCFMQADGWLHPDAKIM